MKMTIIWIADEKIEKNRKTLEFLKKEMLSYARPVQVLLYGADPSFRREASDLPGLETVDGFEGAEECTVYRHAADNAEGEYLTQLYGGDTWTDGILEKMAACISRHPDRRLYIVNKKMPDDTIGAFSGNKVDRETVFFLNRETECHPFYFGGTFVKKSLLKEGDFSPAPPLEGERKLFLSLCIRSETVVFLPGPAYCSAREREGDLLYFHGIYEKSFYRESFTEFWLPWLAELKEKHGTVPLVVQTHFLFTVTRRFLANWNNRNKHVIDEEEAEELFGWVSGGLAYIDDHILMNAKKIADINVGDTVKWVLGILKYGKDYTFGTGYLSGNMYYAEKDVMFNTIKSLRTNILFMDARDGVMEIDGTVHPVLYAMADRVYFEFAGKIFEPVYNERYALTKVLGVSIAKAHSFHVSIPYINNPGSVIYCFAEFGKEKVKILYGYESHFSRINNRFMGQYWAFEDRKQPFIMSRCNDGLRIEKSSKKLHRKKELALWKQMMRTKNDRKRAWLFILIRLAYFATRKFIKRRPIWMYLDKIYKAGDSSEYLYKYASAQDNNFRHYYLVDKKSADYRRLKKEGYHPLVRGTIKHRLVFLMADMMVISNSTVFAFNNFGMVNSGYIRDLPDFHVCCVQHGMSVQQIAVAQNRLRDNTRLYFCASKYEIENLSRPVYDYAGYGALKLTGVPRYDGLVNNDQKQILISPTWRMQAATPVRTSEGEVRDYNPLFKESTYFRIYNALINDSRLIEAAKKYGYRIKYVLHPIVSSQVEDFDRNDYVDIIPAVGDMSYEKMFCESSLMVTDFSGVQFDFAYMRKPVVYLHHRDIPQHYEEGSFYYDTMAFGEICHDNDELISVLEEYMADGCRMKEEYVRRADDFFFYNDRNNCRRIYNAMLAYQEQWIFPELAEARKARELAENHYTFAPVPKVDLLAAKGDDEKLMGEFSLAERKAKLPAYDSLAGLGEEGSEEAGKPSVADYYYDLPIEEKTVVMLGLAHSVRGNLQYILNELNYSDEFEGYRIFVRGWKASEKVVKQFIKENHWKRTEVLISTRKYDEWLSKAQYLLTETYFPEGWTKKPGQIVIDTWHGTPLKKLGLAKNFRNLHKDGGTQRSFIDSDYLLYPNDYTREAMLSSYKVADLMYGKALMLGYPRTGGMMAVGEEEREALREKLAPGLQKIYAYMPTWKDYLEEGQVVAESRDFLYFMDSRLRDDEILYCNLHHKVSDSVDYNGFRHIRQFPANLDSYKLLAATDALITDYSSVFYDYLATRRQIVLYCEDYELYRKRRGTYMDLMELPFDKAMSKEEVVEALRRGKTYDDTEAYERFCRYDSPVNAKKLTSIMADAPDPDLVLKDIPKSGKKQIMIFSERFQASKETDILKEIAAAYNREKNQLYFSGEMYAMDDHKDNSYPLLRDNPVYGMVRDTHLTARGRLLMQKYLERKLSFEEIIPYLQYDYALMIYREYGHVQFDTIVIYDVLDPNLVLALSTMRGEKILFINEEMVQSIRLGDRLLKDALCYAARRSHFVFFMNRQLLVEMQGITGELEDARVCYTNDQILEFFEK